MIISVVCVDQYVVVLIDVCVVQDCLYCCQSCWIVCIVVSVD